MSEKITLGELEMIINLNLIPQFERQLKDHEEDLRNKGDSLGYMYAKGYMNAKQEDLYILSKTSEQLALF